MAPAANPRLWTVVLLGIRSDLFLRGFLTFAVLTSGWAFLPGRIDGQIAFVLYSPAKLAVTLIGVWWFLALFLVLRRRRLDALDLWATIRNPPVALLGLLLLWFAISTLWAEVSANGLFELSLYLPLFMLTVVLVAWMRSDTRVRPAVELSLIVFAAVATVVGGLQLAFEPRWLTAINPLDEVGNPSVMGYKNPMALAVAGQLFVLYGRIAMSSKGPWRGLMVGVALAELAYLGQLESRTSLAAVVVGTIGLLAAAAAWPPSGATLRRLAGAVGVAVLVLGLGVSAVPAARQKAATLWSYAVQPSSYLESDRGVYLRNTLNMVRHHPWGIGTGDWQTQYPVYRLHDRYRSYHEVYEVRRAHSDHVQILGENGWLGLAVWLAFLAAVVAGLARSYRESRDVRDLFLLGQIVFWVSAMATDYVLDLPFHRLVFFLWIACSLAPEGRPPTVAVKGAAPAAGLFPPWARHAGIVVAVSAALLTSAVALSGLRLAYDNAVMTRFYLQALSNDGARRSQLLRRAVSHGSRLFGPAIHSKTRYKDWQVLGDVFRRLGARDAARRCALRALELHPYSPKTFNLLAKLHSGEEGRRWQEGHDYIYHEATAGYRLEPIPDL